MGYDEQGIRLPVQSMSVMSRLVYILHGYIRTKLKQNTPAKTLACLSLNVQSLISIHHGILEYSQNLFIRTSTVTLLIRLIRNPNTGIFLGTDVFSLVLYFVIRMSQFPNPVRPDSRSEMLFVYNSI